MSLVHRMGKENIIAAQSAWRFQVGSLATRGHFFLKAGLLACPEGNCCMRKDLGSILAFDDFDGALEQDNKVRAEVRLRSMSVLLRAERDPQRVIILHLESSTVACKPRLINGLSPLLVHAVCECSTLVRERFQFYVSHSSEVRSLRSVFIFATLSKQQLQRPRQSKQEVNIICKKSAY